MEPMVSAVPATGVQPGALAGADDPGARNTDGTGRRKPSRGVLWLAGVAVVVTLGWLYGVVPFSGRTFALPTTASMDGWVTCLEDGLWPCTYVGYPEGVDLSVSMPLVGGVYLLTRVGLGVEAALNVLAFGALGAGFAAMWHLTAAITRHTAAAIVGAGLYCISPLLVTHTDKTGLWLGFVLLPVPVAVTFAVLSGGRRPSLRRLPRPLGAAVLLFLGALLIVYLDPYAWTIATVLCAPMCVVAAAGAVHRRGWLDLAVAGVTLAAVLAPGVVFRAAEPSAEAASGFSRDVYRAFGADVLTALVPTRGSVLWDAVRWPASGWDPTRFRGDGTQIAGAYLGVTVVVAALVGGVHLLRRADPDRSIIAALVAGGVACLALGLGPSLKLADTWPDTARTSSIWRMPASEATATLPWSGVYGVQPFEGMRAAYRWHAGARLVLAVLATAAVVVVLRRGWSAGKARGAVVAVAVAAVLVLDTTSHALVDARRTARDDHEAHQALLEDVDRELGRGQLEPSERVLFLPATNDYLIMAIAPRLRVFAYNASFDKEVARVRRHQPPTVLAAIGAYDAWALTPGHVCSVFRADAADVVVFTDFDMRGDSGDWPPPDDSVESLEQRNRDTGVLDDPAFDVVEQDLTSIVRPAGGADGACAPP